MTPQWQGLETMGRTTPTPKAEGNERRHADLLASVGNVAAHSGLCLQLKKKNPQTSPQANVNNSLMETILGDSRAYQFDKANHSRSGHA